VSEQVPNLELNIQNLQSAKTKPKPKQKSGFFEVTFLQFYPKSRGLISDTEAPTPVDPFFGLQRLMKREVYSHGVGLLKIDNASLWTLSSFSRTIRSK